METRGIMGGFYRFSEWVMRFSAINLLWIISSSPVLAALWIFSAWTAQIDDFARYLGWWLVLGFVCILNAFTFVPASSAMFAVARKWVMGDVDVPLWRTYWKSYKANYKQSLFGGLLFSLFLGIFLFNIHYYSNVGNVLNSLALTFIVMIVLLFAAFLNFLSIMSHLHMSTFQIVKNSFLITIGQPINTLILLVLNAGIVYISILYNFLIVFFMGSVMAMISFWNFYRGFTKIQARFKKSEEDEEEEEDSEESEDSEDSDEELTEADPAEENPARLTAEKDESLEDEPSREERK